LEILEAPLQVLQGLRRLLVARGPARLLVAPRVVGEQLDALL
jgi:hypothetical protein